MNGLSSLFHRLVNADGEMHLTLAIGAKRN
jgi:hypothetical protein